MSNVTDDHEEIEDARDALESLIRADDAAAEKLASLNRENKLGVDRFEEISRLETVREHIKPTLAESEWVLWRKGLEPEHTRSVQSLKFLLLDLAEKVEETVDDV